MAARQRSPERYPEGRAPTWRLFQLAFVLLSLRGLVDETHPDREEVELIFFPTGGGKTEAYLGVIAFTLLLRRLRGAARPDGASGSRSCSATRCGSSRSISSAGPLRSCAHSRCCAARTRASGRSASRWACGWAARRRPTPWSRCKKLILDYKNSTAKNPPSPFPLTNCPWCGGALGRDSLVLAPRRRPRRSSRAACRYRGSPRLRVPSRRATTPKGSRCSSSTSRSTASCRAFSSPPSTSSRCSRGAARPGMLFGRVTARGRADASSARWTTAPRGATRVPRRAAPARAHRAGRAAPHLGPARHDGGPLRDGHRGTSRAAPSTARSCDPRSSLRRPRCAARASRSARSSGAAQMSLFPPPGGGRLGDVLRARRSASAQGACTWASRRPGAR